MLETKRDVRFGVIGCGNIARAPSAPASAIVFRSMRRSSTRNTAGTNVFSAMRRKW